jgi:hypothetical protein
MGDEPRRPVWWYLPDHHRSVSRRPWILGLGGKQRGRTRYPLRFNRLRGHSRYCRWYSRYMVSLRKASHSFTVANLQPGLTLRMTRRDTLPATPSTCAAKSASYSWPLLVSFTASGRTDSATWASAITVWPMLPLLRLRISDTDTLSSATSTRCGWL